MEFRPRNYTTEEEVYSLLRVPADTHPLSTPPSSSQNQVDVVDPKKNDFLDPLRWSDANVADSIETLQDEENISTAVAQLPEKEWSSFKKLLMQKFSVSKMVSLSSVSDVLMKSGKVHEKSQLSTHLEELDDPHKFAEEGVKVISQQELVSRFRALKDEIICAWNADDRVTSLKLSIKVARLLMDTSAFQFYPTLFVLATDVMDLLGNMVWERIKRKAEFSEDGTLICSLPENFEARDICFEAKETCNNWFCKIGSIRELLPRIYLELAILPCWRFLLDRPVDNLQRLVKMMRGIADPLASSYCRLYMAYRAQKLPVCDIGYLIACIYDVKIILTRIISAKEITHGDFSENRKALVSLIEPTIEYVMKCIFKNSYQMEIEDVLKELGLGRNQTELYGKFPCTSVFLHHLLKELPTGLVNSNAMVILQLIECSNDYSFEQCLNYRLLGFRLSEQRSQMDIVHAVVNKVIQVASQYNSLDEFLKVVDAYMDNILQNQMDNYLDIVLDGILKRANNEEIAENKHFFEILDVMHGSSRSIVNVAILNMASRSGCICDPTMIKLLFEVSQALHDSIKLSNMRDDDYQQLARLISRFVNMVDYGPHVEHHLTFLVECRGAFGSINELKETLVHASNCLVIKAIKGGKEHLSFVKSCIAFSEVTIPSVPAHIRQMNLYLETAEIALLSGLVSHSDGLIESAISCFQDLVLTDGSRLLNDVDGILSFIQKLCSFLVLVPGNLEQEVTYIPKSILSLINSQLWITRRMQTRVLCSILSLLASLSQNKLPYRANHEEILGNDTLFFGDPTYSEELLSFSTCVVQTLVSCILQEPSQAIRGSMALEACNCVASSFRLNHEVLLICSKLMETAKLSLKSNDKYLQATMNFVDELLPPASPEDKGSSVDNRHIKGL
ncbi:uncharacterized protein LOC132311079 isoform X2 [Cornus florida]|uniref:uncharacterized protein LOC132311079 isoform X2 n=1 Tax=Cornus florida TaxID=4283 RepID=UPI0028990F94|nr:uncharacterized protein LOC132311079 isoform X2 [Cornus florida]